MSSKAIPTAVKEEVERAVQAFNEAEFKDNGSAYTIRFRGAFLYLDRIDDGARPVEICRLTYTGDPQKWEFAIFRHSNNRYDPEEWFFPGSELVDGTVTGALRAGLEAYPLTIRPRLPGTKFLGSLFNRLLGGGKPLSAAVSSSKKLSKKQLKRRKS